MTENKTDFNNIDNNENDLNNEEKEEEIKVDQEEEKEDPSQKKSKESPLPIITNEGKDKEFPFKENDFEILSETNPNYDLSFKIIVIGNSGVGKSCLTIRATKQVFENNYLTTVGFEFFTFNVRIGDKIVKLQIWDTCGQEVYRALITNFYRNSSLAIIVYAINDLKSFEDIDMWLKELKTNSCPDIKVFLIGNKADLEGGRKVATKKGENYKNNYKLDEFMETSAKTGLNTQKLFVEAAKLLLRDYIRYKKEKERLAQIGGQKIKDRKQNVSHGGCC